MKTILVDAVNCFVSGTGDIFTDMHQLLESYPNRKVILTGANDEQFKTFGLNKMPYEVFTLKHNPEKADPAYFTTTLTHFNLATSDVIYFEHNPAAVASAQSVGITSYHFDHTTRNLPALKQFIDQNP